VKIDPEGSYFMPVSFGATRPIQAGVFEDVWTLSTSYLTDRDALAGLLPDPFEPSDEPMVTVFYQNCAKVNFLAGGGYNLMGINLAATFAGAEYQLSGEYVLVLWENQVNPIIRGRELLGVPKLFADIPAPDRIGDDWRVHASENGRPLLEMSIEARAALDEEATGRMNADLKKQPWMSWKYIPNVNGFGAAVSHATQIGRECVVAKAWTGAGSVVYGDLTWETNPGTADIVAAVKRLTVKEYVRSTIAQGSMTITRALNRVLA
jgi:acetoacetate decarboxylase